MFDLASPPFGPVLLSPLTADHSGRVRIKSLLNEGSATGDPSWAHWRHAQRFAVRGWGHGIVALSCSPWSPAPGGHVSLDRSGRLNLGMLAGYVGLGNRMLALADADSAQLVLVESARASAALAALISFSVSDACQPFDTPLGSHLGNQPDEG